MTTNSIQSTGSTSPIVVTGSDGYVPVHEPNRRWTQWNYDEIYALIIQGSDDVVLPGPGEGRYIPNINDLVIDIDLWKWFKVVGLNWSSGVATLKEISPPKDPGNLTDEDVLLGIGPGGQSDTYRIYIDQSVKPFTLAVDARLYVRGQLCQYAMIFKGTDINDRTGKVISAFYDQSGNLQGQKVPLELASIENSTNIATKCVSVCHTTEELADGDTATVVFYNDQASPVSWRQCVVKNTSFIRTTDSAQKYIKGVSLESPWVSPSDPRLLKFPINVPLRSLPIKGVVEYTDGSVIKLPIDGQKFKLSGLENYVATIVGQKIPLVLSYTLSAGEINYGSSVGAQPHVSEQYWAQTDNKDGAYTLKLFGYPVWIDRVNGYRLEWFLYNLDRQTVYKVTPWVKLVTGSRAFDPLGYGINQQLRVQIDLSEVNGLFTAHVFTQTIGITLRAPGDERTTNWTIAFDPNQSPEYGNNIHADATFVNYNLWKLKVDFGAASKEDWLNQLYSRAMPLTDPDREAAPPEPNYFALVFGNQRVEQPISQWNAEMTVGNGLVNNDTLFIEFFKRTTDNDIQLSIAGLPIYQTT